MKDFDKQYDPTNRGCIYKNDKKSERQPDFGGPLNVEGKEYRISAWKVDKTKESDPILRFKITAKEDIPKKQPTPNLDEDSNDVPF